MAQRRWLAPWKNRLEKPAIYHVINRVVDRRFVFGSEEKEKFRMFMRLIEKFSGCQVLSYCVMSNHFHVLLEVPPRVAGIQTRDGRIVALAAKEGEEAGGILLAEEEFFQRMRELYSDAAIAEIEGKLSQYRERGSELEEARLFQSYAYRMQNLSEFMKNMTQRFTRWFNRTHDRTGRLWEERFKSLLVEDGVACRTIAAYIDLNPVRAGIVNDPADYRWSSYGEAVAGGKKARAGLVRALDREKNPVSNNSKDSPKNSPKNSPKSAPKKDLARAWAQGGLGKEYRRLLLGEGQEVVIEARVVKKGMKREQAEKELAVLNQRGSKDKSDLAISQVIRHRVRYFSDGLVIGGKDFVNEFFQSNRERFGANRKTGARVPRGTLEPMKEHLWSIRDLQTE